MGTITFDLVNGKSENFTFRYVLLSRSWSKLWSVSDKLRARLEMTQPVKARSDMTLPVKERLDVTSPVKTWSEMTRPVKARSDMSRPVQARTGKTLTKTSTITLTQSYIRT